MIDFICDSTVRYLVTAVRLTSKKREAPDVFEDVLPNPEIVKNLDKHLASSCQPTLSQGEIDADKI